MVGCRFLVLAERICAMIESEVFHPVWSLEKTKNHPSKRIVQSIPWLIESSVKLCMSQMVAFSDKIVTFSAYLIEIPPSLHDIIYFLRFTQHITLSSWARRIISWPDITNGITSVRCKDCYHSCSTQAPFPTTPEFPLLVIYNVSWLRQSSKTIT